jgi:transcriptional regulator with XRE-family HTH domain
MVDRELGLRVRAAREAKGLSQTGLAQLVGTTQSAIARLEGGASRPTVASLRRIAGALDLELSIDFELTSPVYDSGATCFIIGPIGNRHAQHGSAEREIYDKAIEVLEEVILPACEQAGLRPMRADQFQRSGEIGDQVVRLLREADVVIADLTATNPNVMYELGLRHSTSGITIPIANTNTTLPFDVRGFRTILFKHTPAGLARARRELAEALRAAAMEGYDLPSATRVWHEDAMPELSATPALDSLSTAMRGVDEIGPAELLADMEEAMPEFVNTTTEISHLIGDIGDLTREATERLSRSDSEGRGFKGRLAVIHWYGEGLDGHVSAVDQLVSAFEQRSATIASGLDALFEVVAQFPDQNEDAGVFMSTLASMVENVAVARTNVQRFVDALDVTSRLSSSLRPRIRRLRASLDRLLTAMARIENSASPALGRSGKSQFQS